MSDYPSSKQFIRWYVRNQGLLGRLRFAAWMCLRPRNYARLVSKIKRLLPTGDRPSETQTHPTIPEDFGCETARLILRPLKTADLDAIGDLPMPEETWSDRRAYITTLMSNWFTLVAIGKESNEVVGIVSLRIYNIDGRTEYELGYRVHFEQFGKGYATESALAVRDLVFEQLGVNRLISLIWPSNVASIRVAEKNGMHLEREWGFGNGMIGVYAVNRSDLLQDSEATDASALTV